MEAVHGMASLTNVQKSELYHALFDVRRLNPSASDDGETVDYPETLADAMSRHDRADQ
jgi:hypothetical protein